MTREPQTYIVWCEDNAIVERAVIAHSALGALAMHIAEMLDDGAYSDFVDVIMEGPGVDRWRVRRPDGSEFVGQVQWRQGEITILPVTGAENTPWADPPEAA